MILKKLKRNQNEDVHCLWPLIWADKKRGSLLSAETPHCCRQAEDGESGCSSGGPPAPLVTAAGHSRRAVPEGAGAAANRRSTAAHAAGGRQATTLPL